MSSPCQTMRARRTPRSRVNAINNPPAATATVSQSRARQPVRTGSAALTGTDNRRFNPSAIAQLVCVAPLTPSIPSLAKSMRAMSAAARPLKPERNHSSSSICFT
jgi:hypothetical protein